jgi:hypothetical protein
MPPAHPLIRGDDGEIKDGYSTDAEAAERAELGPGVSRASRSAPGSDPDRRCVCNPSIEAEHRVLLTDGGVNSVFRKRRPSDHHRGNAALSIFQSRPALSRSGPAKFTALRLARSLTGCPSVVSGNSPIRSRLYHDNAAAR